MAVKYALLGLLSEVPMHGYDLKRAFDDKLGDFWSLNFGQIYTTLERLKAEGFVEYDEVSQQDKPDKKVYRITDRGLAEFRDWRLRPIKAEPRALRDELFIKILFMDMAELDSVLGFIQTQQSVYMTQMMQLTDRKFQIEQQARRALQKATTPEERQKVDRERLVNSLLIDVALLHAEADIRWLRQCEAKLKEVL
ncbi:MAG: PadR family transcriptional regulator [Anaerolineae bacterium]